jgi:hypothetical protein
VREISIMVNFIEIQPSSLFVMGIRMMIFNNEFTEEKSRLDSGKS